MNPIAHLPLALLPTPLHELPRLSAALGGPRLLVKRDDLTGLAFGGNKTRKLAYLLADARAQGADVLITAGAVQSNHCRQTAAAAAWAGLDCVLVLRGDAPARASANLLLDGVLGARVRWAGAADRATVMQDVARELAAQGRRPYVIPYGGSNALGAAAYAHAMHELVAQLGDTRVNHIVFASSSGGTQAGLVAGARSAGFRSQVLGISVDEPAAHLRAVVAGLATAVAELLGLGFGVMPEEVTVNDGYLGAGYAIMGAVEREAIALAARTEGLLVDPVYTGRALAGLIDLVRRGAFSRDETVLFWHTGGQPALFADAYQELGDALQG
jgi:D-cysteine desulfhydrase family pyridoxal phosphate-dependent enzyme